MGLAIVIPITQKARWIARNIKLENEADYVAALWVYYCENFQNGGSAESFLLWLEGLLEVEADMAPDKIEAAASEVLSFEEIIENDEINLEDI